MKEIVKVRPNAEGKYIVTLYGINFELVKETGIDLPKEEKVSKTVEKTTK